MKEQDFKMLWFNLRHNIQRQLIFNDEAAERKILPISVTQMGLMRRFLSAKMCYMKHITSYISSH